MQETSLKLELTKFAQNKLVHSKLIVLLGQMAFWGAVWWTIQLYDHSRGRSSTFPLSVVVMDFLACQRVHVSVLPSCFSSPLLRVSHPSQVVLPFPRWEPKEKPVKEDDVGPQVTHIYEVHVCSTSLLTSRMRTNVHSVIWVEV